MIDANEVTTVVTVMVFCFTLAGLVLGYIMGRMK